MASATLTDCINRISAIATRLQETPEKAAALELQQCLEVLAEVQQQQQVQAPVCQDLEQTLHKSQLCSRIAHSITTGRIYGLTLEKIVDNSLKQIHRAFPDWRIAYSTIDPHGQLTVIQSLEPEDMPPLTGLKADLTIAPEFLAALRRGAPVIVDDVTNSSIIQSLAEVMLAGGTQAVLDVPLKPYRNLVGLLCLDSPRSHGWNEHEIGAMIEIADYFSYALQEIEVERERQQVEAELHRANHELKQYAAQLEAANRELEITLQELRQGNEELMVARTDTEQQRQRYQDLFNFAPDGYLVTNSWGVIQEANQAARRLLAASSDRQILGKPLSVFIPLEERPTFRTQLNQLRILYQPIQLEINLQPKQGSSFSAAIAATAIQDWQGERDRFFWLIRDISDKKRAELALQQLNQELEERVQQRTAQLSEANAQLQAEITERLQIEAERSRLIAILEASADYIATATTQGYVLWRNPQLKKIRGLNPDADVTHLHIADYHPQWAFGIIQQQGIPTAIRDGVWFGETALLDENEQEIPVSQMIIAHKSAGGTVGYLSIVMRNISDRKAAELSLRAVSDRLQYLLTSNPAVIFSCEPEGDYTATFMSPNVSTILGYEAQEFLNSSQFWAMRVHADDLERIIGNFSKIFEQGSCSYEYRFLHADETYHWLSSQLRLIQDEAGNPIECVGYLIDISDRKLAEEKLRETQQHLQAILDYSPTVIYLTDRNNNYLFVNRQLKTLVSTTLENLIGKSMYEVWPTEICDAFAANNQQILQSGEPMEFEEVAPHADGLHTYITIKFPLYDAKGVAYGVGGISADITDKKQAEEAHRRSEARFRALMQTSPDIITLSTSDGGVFYQSPAVERILGYAPEEFVGELPLQALHPDDRENLQATTARMLANPGAPISLEYRLRHKNGSWVWLEGIGTNLLDEPDIQAFVIFSRDIRDRKRAEEELQASQHFIQKIADASPNLLYLYDLEEQRNIYVNREITQMMGYSPEEVQAMGNEFFLNLMHPDDLSVSPEKLKQIDAASDGEAIEFEYRMRHKNGEWRWLYSWDTVFARNADGKPTQILGTATDISDRKHLELALQQSEERFRTCVENLLDPLAIFSSIRDATGQIVDLRYEYINPAGCQSNRMPQEAMLGKPMCELFPVLRDIGLFDAYSGVVETGKSWIKESVCLEVVADGQPFPLFFDIQAVKLGDGLMVTWRDVTERKQADAQIQASLQEKEVLLKEIHHRVKNNLQVILSLLRLQSSYTTDPKTLQMFQESQNRIQSMALIHELLYHSHDLARIDFAVYIRTLVNQLARTYTVTTDAISWEINVEPASIQLTIDTALPCGLMINELVSNALKYAFPTGQGGKIRISLQACNNGELILVIRDNGVGISSDLDFRHTDSLGLQLVCGTTAQLGGTIELDRTQGTTFTIRFKEVVYKPRR